MDAAAPKRNPHIVLTDAAAYEAALYQPGHEANLEQVRDILNHYDYQPPPRRLELMKQMFEMIDVVNVVAKGAGVDPVVVAIMMGGEDDVRALATEHNVNLTLTSDDVARVVAATERLDVAIDTEALSDPRLRVWREGASMLMLAVMHSAPLDPFLSLGADPW